MRKKRSKLLFPCGLLSLGVMPFLFLPFLNHSRHHLSERILPLVFWDLDNPPPFGESFNNYIINKDYTHFYLTNNDQQNRKVLKAASTKIKHLVNSGDTTIGVHFYIPDNACFQLFIEAIDLCKQLNAEVYIPHDNDVWVMNALPEIENNANRIIIGCGTSWNSIPPDPAVIQKELKRKQKEQLDYIFETAWIYKFSILLFTVMIVINTRKIMQPTKHRW